MLHTAGPSAIPGPAAIILPAYHTAADAAPFFTEGFDPLAGIGAPAGFVCPITTEVFVDPVTAADGHSYERSAIERWLLDHNTSPKTNMALPHKMLIPNHALRGAVTEWREKQRQKQQQRGAS